jgi:hypothetical protein
MFAGCSGYLSGTGDLSFMISSNIRSYGGNIPTNRSHHTISTSWAIKKDSEGFIVRYPSIRFQDIDKYFRELLGEPDIWMDKSDAGYPLGVFSAKRVGVAIQYYGGENEGGIICIKPRNLFIEGAEQGVPPYVAQGAPSGER